MSKLVIKYLPFPGQKRFHESKARFRAVITGVGFGKTAAGVNELIKVAMSSPPGCKYVLVAPTYKMLKNATLPEFFKFCSQSIIKDFRRGDMIIELINGVTITCCAGDREDLIDRLRGMTIAGAYGDEISMCPEYMHNMLIARMRDDRGAMKIWYTTTPKGFDWLYRIFFEKKKKNGHSISDPEEYEIFGGSTMENPYTPDTYKQFLKDTYVGEFAQQELYGQFIGFSGLVFRDFNRDIHLIEATMIFEDSKVGITI